MSYVQKLYVFQCGNCSERVSSASDLIDRLNASVSLLGNAFQTQTVFGFLQLKSLQQTVPEIREFSSGSSNLDLDVHLKKLWQIKNLFYLSKKT